MRSPTTVVRFLAAGALVALLAGCDQTTGVRDPNPAGTDWESSIDLESAYGGYTLSDEPAAFGDPEVLNIESLESLSAPDPTDFDSIPADSVFAVRVLWGQLDGNPNAPATVDWTGSVAINQGRMGLRRTIAFEPPTDFIVRPRPNPQTIQFVSFTRSHYDGLLVLVHLVPSDVPTTFSFDTGPYTNTWPLDQLVGANLVIPVDANGNAVSIDAVPVSRLACPAGFARGVWQARDHGLGHLRGVWLSSLGDPSGFLRGHFGVNRAGEHVWFAKIIEPRGRIIGLARGTWEPNTEPGVPGGRFTGRFMSRHADGEIAGTFLPGEAGGSGFFEAQWQMQNCGRGPGGGPGNGPPGEPPMPGDPGGGPGGPGGGPGDPCETCPH